MLILLFIFFSSSFLLPLGRRCYAHHSAPAGDLLRGRAQLSKQKRPRRSRNDVPHTNIRARTDGGDYGARFAAFTINQRNIVPSLFVSRVCALPVGIRIFFHDWFFFLSLFLVYARSFVRAECTRLNRGVHLHAKYYHYPLFVIAVLWSHVV